MASAGTDCIPFDACIHIIEVKSCLTAEELRKTIKTALQVSKMVTSLPGPASAWETLPSRAAASISIPTVFSIFAFDSDLAKGGKSELERFREVLISEVPEGSTVPGYSIHDLSVVGRGYWKQPILSDACHPAGSGHEEVIEFLTMAADSWPVWMGTRGTMRIRPYL